MKTILLILIFILDFSCKKEESEIIKINVKFKVIDEVDSIGISNIKVSIFECKHKKWVNVVNNRYDGYTDKNGYCEIKIDFDNNNRIYYTMWINRYEKGQIPPAFGDHFYNVESDNLDKSKLDTIYYFYMNRIPVPNSI